MMPPRAPDGSQGEAPHCGLSWSTDWMRRRPTIMKKNEPTTEESTTLTDLSAVSTGTIIRLSTEPIVLERVEQLGAVHNALSPVDGQNLTRITFRERGRVKRRIFPSLLSVERMRHPRSKA
jgi:hypothetical protein